MPQSTTCTVQLPTGEFCDSPADPRIGYPVCGRHALHIFRDVMLTYEIEGANPYRRIAEVMGWQVATSPARPAVIYYLLVDGLVKIGVSTDLPRRLRTYPPTAMLLGTEPGDAGVETARHAEFAEYLTARREWFTPGPRLREHIESLTDYRAA